MSYTSDKTAYNAAINTAITTQTSANTIPPEEVGGGMTDLADLLEPYINAINNQALLFGPGVPSSGLGVNLDLYFQQGNPIIIYRKLAGSWVEQGQLPLDFTLPDGNLTVQTSIAGFIVSASYGGWVIDGTVYSKSTQTQLTLDAANTNYYRYDNIYATTSGTILYQVGTASASPVAPTLPADTILIDVAIVPSVVSGFVPYLQSGGNGNDLLHRSGVETLTYGATKKWTDGTFWAQLDGGGLQAGNAGYTTVVSNSTLSAGNIAGTVQTALSFNGLTFFNSTFNTKLAAAALTANRTITMPDASGTLALLSDISTPSNSITNDTSLQTGADFNIDGNGQASSFITTGDGFKFAGTNEGQIINDTLTADRIWKMPNASGTLVLSEAGYFSGNVGIGTVAPASKVDITDGPKSVGTITPFRLSTTDATDRMELIFTRAGTNYYGIQSVEQNIGNKPLVLNGAGGNVGIGFTSPLYRVDVRNTSDYQLRVATADVYGDGGILIGSKGAADPNYYGELLWNQAAQTCTLNAQGGELRLGTSIAGVAPSDRVVVSQTGDVGFNATTSPSATSARAKLWAQTVSGTTDLYAMNSAGTSGKVMIGTFLNGSTSYSPSLVAGASAFVTFTVTGASLGDFVMGSFSLSLGNLMLSAHVSAADTVTIVLYNPSGVTQTLGSGTLRARILKM